MNRDISKPAQKNQVRCIQQQFWSSQTLPYLKIRTTVNSCVAYKAHCHEELSLGVLFEGQTCLSSGNIDKVLKARQSIFIAPNQVHACNPINGGSRSYHMLYIDKSWCLDVLECEQPEYELIVKPNASDAVDRTRLLSLIDSLINDGSAGSINRLDNYLKKLIFKSISVNKPSLASSQLALNVRQLLLSDIVTPPSVEALAHNIGRPVESVIRSFKREYGMTPKAFLNNIRVEQAKHLLRDGGNIVDVALDVGFSDQSQFHKAFVHYTASTPGQHKTSTSIFDNNV
ncbi:AraC family transcriptional regulator [Vibrio sp.]|nr:AraC family transcriptional regulator [Vibrio sp.]